MALSREDARRKNGCTEIDAKLATVELIDFCVKDSYVVEIGSLIKGDDLARLTVARLKFDSTLWSESYSKFRLRRISWLSVVRSARRRYCTFPRAICNLRCTLQQ